MAQRCPACTLRARSRYVNQMVKQRLANLCSFLKRLKRGFLSASSFLR